MISVVLATYNEEKNIEACLQAVRDIADEIIVVDGTSTDTTVSRAKKYTSKVFSTTNKPNFHINKQMAMDKAEGDIVLQLDADEIVDAELKKFIKTLHQDVLAHQTNEKKLDGYQPKAWWIRRKNLFLGSYLKKGGQYPDPVIRLYINGFAKLPQKDVHEQMVVDGELGWAKGHLLHNSNPSFADYLRKFNTYTSFAAQQLHGKKKHPNIPMVFSYMFTKPTITFFSLFVRHKGFVDGLAGFVFALMSALHFPVTILKLWELYVK